MYGAYAEHVIYYLVDADSLGPIQQFLVPSFSRCSTTITPVIEEPVGVDRRPLTESAAGCITPELSLTRSPSGYGARGGGA